MNITPSQSLSHATRHAGGDAAVTAWAKRAIPLVEQALKDKYGVEVNAGVELEYSVKILEELKEALEIPEEVKDEDDVFQGGNDDDSNPTKEKPESKELFVPIEQWPAKPLEGTYKVVDGKIYFGQKVSSALFPNNPWVAYSYSEELYEHEGEDWQKYETVISHLGKHASIPFGQGRMNALAAAVTAIRKIVAHPETQTRDYVNGFRKSAKPLSDKSDQPLPEGIHNDWIDRIAQGIQERCVNACKKTIDEDGSAGDIITHGMHLNLSMKTDTPYDSANNVKSKIQLLQHPATREEDESKRAAPNKDGYEAKIIEQRSKPLFAGLSDIFCEAAWLLMPSDACYERQMQRKELHGTSGEVLKGPKLFKHIELKQPSIESNPYLVNLFGLLGVYHAMERFAYDRNAVEFKQYIEPSLKIHNIAKNNGNIALSHVQNGLFDADYQPYYMQEPDYKQMDMLKQQMKERFSDGKHVIRDTLNAIEVGLGDELESLVVQSPPHTWVEKERSISI